MRVCMYICSCVGVCIDRVCMSVRCVFVKCVCVCVCEDVPVVCEERVRVCLCMYVCERV